jgi:hypothetical protein
MILTLLDFNFTRGYIYITKKKEDGFDDDCLRYQTITNSTQKKNSLLQCI